MVPEINAALRRLLYVEGHIPAQEVDVRFEAPTKDWIDSLTRPTISLYLTDVCENTELRRIDMQVARENGRGKLQLPPRRIDLKYMVSAITTEIDDEQRLLWRTLATLMRFPHLPAETLPEALREVEPPIATQVAQPDDGAQAVDIWSAFGAPPRPALRYVVTAPLDLEHVFDVPLVLTRTVRFSGAWDGAGREERHQIGGHVRAADGRPLTGVVVTLDGRALAGSVTDDAGQYALAAVPPGTITLRATRADGKEATVTVSVPSDTYDITLDA